MPGTDDLALNPEKLEKSRQKKNAVAQIKGLITLVTHQNRFKRKN
jgi:hypothetical protein